MSAEASRIYLTYEAQCPEELLEILSRQTGTKNLCVVDIGYITNEVIQRFKGNEAYSELNVLLYNKARRRFCWIPTCGDTAPFFVGELKDGPELIPVEIANIHVLARACACDVLTHKERVDKCNQQLFRAMGLIEYYREDFGQPFAPA